MTVFDKFRLDGQTAIVTGGSKSLGKAMARAFPEAGADVVICARNKAEVEAAAKELADATGRRIMPHAADLTRREQLEALVTDTISRFGRIDILVNNAGIGYRARIQDTPDEEWQKVIDIDLTSCFRMSKLVVPHMVKRRYGRVINISSALGAVVFPGRAAY